MKVKISKEEIIKASLYGLKIINGTRYALLNVDYDIELEAEPIEEKESHPQIKEVSHKNFLCNCDDFKSVRIHIEELEKDTNTVVQALNEVIRAVNALSK